MDELLVLDYNGEGYFSHFNFDEWRIAYLNYAPMFTKEGITYLERHNETDEVFILLEGSASLFMGENAREVVMEKFLSYVVKKSAWHNIVVSEDARVLIVENKNTGKHNSEYLPFKF
ncbi:MAG: hypothetical protein IKM27_04660 [Clostridia bacterium]|nr:hypothetical protein [Clostridia bacterium]